MALTPLLRSLSDLNARWRSDAGGVFDIRDYGAVAGDATTDTITAITAAITAANAAGGGEVAVPSGAWYVKPSTTRWIELRSNVRVRLHRGARIKVRDDTGDYKYLISAPGGPSTLVEHAAWSGGTIDHNASGNTGCDVSLTNPQATFRFDNFSDLTFDGVRLDPYTGVNAFQLLGSSYNADSVEITNCRAIFERGAATTLYDTSTVYAAAQLAAITNNTFRFLGESDFPQGAIEVHGPHQVVSGNRVERFAVGTWLVRESSAAITADDFGVVCANNVYTDVALGIGLASGNPAKILRQAVVANNVIRVNSLIHDRITFGGVMLSGDTGWAPAEDVLISGNTIDYVTGETRTVNGLGQAIIWDGSAGIVVTVPAAQTTKGITVTDNIIRNAPGTGLRVMGGAGATLEDVWIHHNQIIDAGLNTSLAGTARVGIGINGTPSFRRCVIEDNRISDTGASALNGVWAWRSPSLTGTTKDLTFRRNWHGAQSGTLGTLLNADIKVDEGTASLNFPSIAAQTCAELTVTVKGALVTDVAYASPANGIEAGLSWSAYVSAADTVTVRVCNPTGSALDPAARTWYVGIQRRQG